MSTLNPRPWDSWDYSLRISAGKVPGVYGENKYAFNGAIVGTPEDIWFAGGTLSFLSSAETMSVVSGSNDDDGNPAGDGARTVTLYGLDGDYNVLKETITMNGMTPVVTQNAFLRVNRMRVETVGDTGRNVGDISATASTAGTLQGTIGAGIGSTLKSQYTVPKGYTAFIRNLTVGTENNDQAQVDLLTRSENGPWIVRYRVNFVEIAFEEDFAVPILVPEKSDVRCTGVRVAGSGNIIVSTQYELNLVENKFVNFYNPFN